MKARKYYLQNQLGDTEEIFLNDDATAFCYAQQRNKKEEQATGVSQNWKAYDERGDLIYYVAYYQN